MISTLRGQRPRADRQLSHDDGNAEREEEQGEVGAPHDRAIVPLVCMTAPRCLHQRSCSYCSLRAREALAGLDFR